MSVRVCVIAGASGGIGAATALALAEPGVLLVLAARSEGRLRQIAHEAEAKGASAMAVAVDVTGESSVRDLMLRAAEAHGRIDVVVNSVGGAAVGAFQTLSTEDWEQQLKAGLTGPFLCCKHAVGHMGAGGLIVNVASVAARQTFPDWSAYAAAKAGLLAFSNAIREELRPRGIRVSVVLPAATDTALWDSVPGNWNRAAMLHAADVGRAIAQLVSQPPEMATEELVIGHVTGRL